MNDTEYLDVVNENDAVIGTRLKSEIYEQALRHRIVHILLFDENGRMALQKRSSTVSFCPLHWSTAVGGHVQSSETYEQAAGRELKEELGIDIPFDFFQKDFYSADGKMEKFLVTHKATYSGSFKFEDSVSEVAYFEIDTIRRMVDNDEKFHPELLFILQKYFF